MGLSMRAARMISLGPACLLSLLATTALVGCGGSSRHPAGKLPAAAREVFVSDRPADLSQVVSVPAGGTLLASLHFDPSRDGFSFQNYGFIAGPELDAHAMRELFGNRVCMGVASDACTLTPPARQWAQATADEMVGGHCFGFAMTALRFFTHRPGPSSYGASTTYGLSFTPALQSEIAYAWATQILPPVLAARRFDTPTGIIAALERAFANPSGDLYTLDIWSALTGEGHAITPIGIADLGGGHYDILVYDNNKPGTTQAVSVDSGSETWSYLVATEPSMPDAVWGGTGLQNEMALVPLSAVLRPQPCPFCRGRGGTGTDTISLSGNPAAHGHLLIQTADGRRLGFLDGKFVNQIPGAVALRPALNEIWRADPEPIYELPASDRVTVTLDGTGATGRDAATVDVIGPGFGTTVSNLRPRSGSRDQLVVSPQSGRVTLRIDGDSAGATATVQVAHGLRTASASVPLSAGRNAIASLQAP